MKNQKTINVLVLEDHFYSNKILSKYLQNLLQVKLPGDQPFEIHSFKSGTSCILNVPKDVDIAVLDYYLTNDESDASVHLNGLEIMRYILRISPNCKIIMVSALRNPSIVKKIKSEGVFAYIDKHVNTHEEVGKAVKEAVDSILAEQQQLNNPDER